MGVYTTIKIGELEGQVKIWNDNPEMVMARLTSSSSVPECQGYKNYSIAMREGGFVLVVTCEIVGWSENPMSQLPVFDKYGDVWTVESYGKDDPFSPENLLKA
jgi:hypothetical protein